MIVGKEGRSEGSYLRSIVSLGRGGRGGKDGEEVYLRGASKGGEDGEGIRCGKCSVSNGEEREGKGRRKSPFGGGNGMKGWGRDLLWGGIRLIRGGKGREGEKEEAFWGMLHPWFRQRMGRKENEGEKDRGRDIFGEMPASRQGVESEENIPPRHSPSG